MSAKDRLKWDARYSAQASLGVHETDPFLDEWLAQASPGRALDIACGSGRQAIQLAMRGFAVDAIDISAVALELARQAASAGGVSINWIEHDLDDRLPVRGPYQLVIQMHYVDVAVTKSVPPLLAPGGLFICQQHLQSTQAVAGPQRAAFRVAPGALPLLVPQLDVLHYAEESFETIDGTRLALARLVARQPVPDAVADTAA